MSEKTKRFFIPPWLDDLDLKPNAFRVYCHLLRRAGDDGRCFTGGKAIAASCRISKDTVWPTLTLLEEKGLVKRQGKKFGSSNNYLVMHSIGGNEGSVDSDTIGGNEGSVDCLQSAEKEGLQSAEKEGLQSAEKEGQEEILFKKSSLKKSNKGASVKNEKSKCEPSPEATQLAILFKNSLPQDADVISTWKKKWPEAFDKQITKGRTVDEIQKVIRWARTDSFWRKNFLTPAKLARRNKDGAMYYDVFKEAMLTDKSKPSGNQPSAVNMGNRKSNSTDI